MQQLTKEQTRDLAATMKLLAEPARLQLVSLLSHSPSRQVDLLARLQLAGTHITQMTVSHHLGRLVGVGLIACERQGRAVMYRLVPEKFEAIASMLAGAGER